MMNDTSAPHSRLLTSWQPAHTFPSKASAGAADTETGGSFAGYHRSLPTSEAEVISPDGAASMRMFRLQPCAVQAEPMVVRG